MDTTLDMQHIFRIRNTYFTVFVVEQDTRGVEHQIFCLFGISQGTDLEYGTSAGDVGARASSDADTSPPALVLVII